MFGKEVYFITNVLQSKNRCLTFTFAIAFVVDVSDGLCRIQISEKKTLFIEDTINLIYILG